MTENAKLLGLAIATPEHVILQSEAKEMATRLFSDRYREFKPLSRVFDNAGINKRYAARPLRGQMLQILDPAEESLPYSGRIRFDGLEGEAPLLVPRVEQIRALYAERLAAHRDGLSTMARAAGWGFATHRTDQPPHLALLSLWQALAPT